MATVLAIPASLTEASSKRYIGALAVGSLHFAAIYVLLTALNIIPSPISTPVIHLSWLPPDSKPVTQPLPPVQAPSTFYHPNQPLPRRPVIEIERSREDHPLLPQNPTGNQNGTTTSTGPTVSARGIEGTHTIPPYPPLALRLAHEGNVQLELTVDEQGRVLAAELRNSSGHQELDAAAIAWVKAHWRYTPAVRDGNPVQSNMSVVVTFRLDHAR